MKHLLTLALCIGFSAICIGQDTSQAEDVMERFFTGIKENNPWKASDVLAETNPKKFRQEPELKNSIAGQFKKFILFSNTLKGYRLLNITSVSPELVGLSYLAIFDENPVLVTVLFYKPDSDWMFMELKMTEELTEILNVVEKGERNSDR